MSSVLKRLTELGGLHDAEVALITMDYTASRLAIEIDDLYANFEGDPAYPGETKGSLLIHGIRDLIIAIDSQKREQPWVHAIDATQTDSLITFKISFSPSGHISGTADEIILNEPTPAPRFG